MAYSAMTEPYENSTAGVTLVQPTTEDVRDSIIAALEQRKRVVNELEDKGQRIAEQVQHLRHEMEQLDQALRALSDIPKIR